MRKVITFIMILLVGLSLSSSLVLGIDGHILTITHSPSVVIPPCEITITATVYGADSELSKVKCNLQIIHDTDVLSLTHFMDKNIIGFGSLYYKTSFMLLEDNIGDATVTITLIEDGQIIDIKKSTFNVGQFFDFSDTIPDNDDEEEEWSENNMPDPVTDDENDSVLIPYPDYEFIDFSGYGNTAVYLVMGLVVISIFILYRSMNKKSDNKRGRRR